MIAKQKRIATSIAALVVLVGLSPPLRAQSFDQVGTRARGMGGAFVAVADDATATWWNPAGISNTLIFDGVADFRHEELIDPQQTPISGETAGLRNTAGGVTVAVPPLGFGYFRVRQTGLEPATAEGGPGRQEEGTAPHARSLLTQQFGVTLAQSIGDFVVVGATVRLVHGTVGSAVAAFDHPDAALDAAADADGPSATKADVDVGVLARAGRVRVGFAARNLASPTFTAADGTPWRVSRVARIGVAVVSEAARAGRQKWTAAFDADLASDETPSGRRRDIAGGIERWFAGRVAVRGGVRASTVDDARVTGSVGGSVAVRSGVFVVGEATAGGDRAASGWGLALHVQY
jgi:hypothetical protein